MTERFNHIIFGARIREYLITNITDPNEVHDTSKQIYELCNLHSTNKHITQTHKELLIRDDIEKNYPFLDGQIINNIFKDSFELKEILEQKNILISQELMILYSCLARQLQVNLLPNMEELANNAKINIEDKARQNGFSETLIQELLEHVNLPVYLDFNLAEIAKTRSIDPNIIAKEVNKHINSLLPTYKGKSDAWREALFWGVINTWEDCFKDYEYKYIDKIIIYFFEKCSIFTDTITMDDTTKIPK